MRALVLAVALVLGLPMSAEAVILGGVRVHLQPGTRQVVTVKHRHGWHATVTFWKHTRLGWQPRLRVRDGRTGYGGLVPGDSRVQGTGTTPLGTYGLISAFGFHPHGSTWALPYQRVRAGDYWVTDNASPYYNRFRNKAQGGFRWWLHDGSDNVSERLTDYPRQYEWSIVTSFNIDQVRHRGAAIFFHVNGSGATGGCVSAPRWFVRAMMRRIDPALAPVIAVGR